MRGHEGRVLLGGLLVSFLDELVDLGESGLKTSYGTLSTSLREEPLTVVPQRVLDEKVEEMCFLKSSSDKQGNNRKQKSDKYSNFETTFETVVGVYVSTADYYNYIVHEPYDFLFEVRFTRGRPEQSIKGLNSGRYTTKSLF